MAVGRGVTGTVVTVILGTGVGVGVAVAVGDDVGVEVGGVVGVDVGTSVGVGVTVAKPHAPRSNTAVRANVRARVLRIMLSPLSSENDDDSYHQPDDD